MGNPWFRQKVNNVPDLVREALVSRHGLDTQTIDRLRFVEKNGHSGGKPVREIRIFDPALIADGEKAIRKYDDLHTKRQAVLFQGHIGRDGSLYLADRRPSQTTRRGQTRVPSA